jgi:tRNA threonylcarbamoyladenosine biosynthesis protein TsaB
MKLPYLLHIETATEVCSVAVSEGERLLAQCKAEDANQHSTHLTLLIADAMKVANLAMSQLSAVALSSGPGSYTSLRVGSSVAKGICFANNIPLVAIDTLQSLAAGSVGDNDESVIYCPMIDARRMEVYTALYDENLELLKPMEAIIIDEQWRAQLLQYGKKIIFSGNGAAKGQTILNDKNFEFRPTICDSSNMLKIAYQKLMKNKTENIAYFSPDYGKAPNITAAKKIF